MRIHSKFRDYFDSVQMHGQDDTVHFVRNTEEFVFPKNLKSKLFESTRTIIFRYLEDNRTGVALFPFVVLFCGKVYRGFKVVEENRYVNTLVDTGKFFYDPDAASEFYQENRRNKKPDFWHKTPSTSVIKDWLSKQGTNELEEYAIKEKISIAYIGEKFVKNPCLADCEFFRVVEAYSAYQELDMFISGVLPRDANMMVKISDKDRINQHGFDEWSFRKLPTKHKA